MSFFSKFTGLFNTPAITASGAGTGAVQETRWRGASRALRSLVNWNPRIGSAVADLPGQERTTLIARSRDAFRSHNIARAALMRCRTNIVGAGLMARPQINAVALGIGEEEADAINADLQTKWEAFFEDPIECDQEATLDGYGLQALALLSAMLNGDAFALTPMELRPGGVNELKIQLIECDRISNKDGAANTELLVDGVELARGGMPQAYWIRTTHPGDIAQGAGFWQRYEAFGGDTGRRRVLHIWSDKDRIGAVRGAPFLAPILEPLKQLERYGSAELMAAVISAMFTVFIEKPAEAFDTNGDPVAPLQGDGSSPVQIALGEGAVVDLGPGEKANTANPGRPNANFDPFFMSVVTSMGAALELPVDELMLRYQSSYSAARAAMLQAWRMYLVRRSSFVSQFCSPIYALWFDEQVASGRVSAPGYADPIRRRAWTNCLWIGPARGAMDESKEAAAAKARIDAGISNESIETMAQTGESWLAVEAQRAREVKIKKANGTYVPSHTEAPKPATEPTPPDPKED